MGSNIASKLQQATAHLEAALHEYTPAPTPLHFLTVAKTFEILVEYAWRALKAEVEDLGLEAPAPKVAVKKAAQLQLITAPDRWLICIDARNNSVHDYFGISESEYIALSRELLQLLRASSFFALHSQPS